MKDPVSNVGETIQSINSIFFLRPFLENASATDAASQLVVKVE